MQNARQLPGRGTSRSSSLNPSVCPWVFTPRKRARNPDEKCREYLSETPKSDGDRAEFANYEITKNIARMKALQLQEILANLTTNSVSTEKTFARAIDCILQVVFCK